MDEAYGAAHTPPYIGKPRGRMGIQKIPKIPKLYVTHKGHKGKKEGKWSSKEELQAWAGHT